MKLPGQNVVSPISTLSSGLVFVILKVKDSVSDVVEKSSLSRLYSKFAKYKSFQELSDLVARTGGDVPNAPPYRHNKAEADNNESFLTFVSAIVFYFKGLNKGLYNLAC